MGTMSKTKSSKKSRKRGRTSGASPVSAAGRSAMKPDTAHPGDRRDLEGGTAAVRPVTDDMMDHAARAAAAPGPGRPPPVLLPLACSDADAPR